MRLFLFAALAASLYAQAPDAGKCSGTPKPFSPGSGDWNGWGVDASGSRFQPTPGITAADVPKLKLKWAFAFPGPVNQRNQAQPVIVGGRVFVGSAAGTVFSLDAATGCTYWSYETGNIARTAIQIVKPQGDARWIAYFGDSGGTAHAVDAQTGQLIWKTKVDDFPLARITGSPVYNNGRLYVPMSSGEETGSGAANYECCKFRGSLSALDAKTGKVIWKTYTIPDPPKQYKTTADGRKMFGPAGASLWSAPIIDEKRKRIYIGSGNSYTGIELPTTDAILAFDLETGSLLWSNQVTPGDNWVPGCPRSALCPENPGDDYDFGSSTLLRNIPGSGGGRDVILASQKSGVVYALDPEQRGKVIWKTRIGVGNGLLGGIGWGMAAEGQTVYAAIADINKPDGTPGLYALKIDTGEKIWSTPAPQGAGNRAQSSAVSAMPGIAFSASFGGHLRAYSTKNGEIVWDFDAVQTFPNTVNGLPGKGGAFNGGGPAIANGVVVATSGYAFAGGQGGNILLAFSVDGK